ncbi:beta-phosphoglucomutase family hydrolase [Frondihabitans sp. PAMC 28766]|uniref:beta-phosphoglucomutase family hydrolase n=1 Tax=Frondihabitans sp. PAMC 28766 TaxID=1795630 RepID=UPI0009EC94F7|nr:beta-phosphoglucomutase family hydrolase [Frondihabitans sp. PAMC 28766]
MPASKKIRAAPGRNASVGLASTIRGCLFDLDGVLTDTARLHAAAWKDTFDPFLLNHARRTGVPFVPFDAITDYDRYVDGKPREDGIRSFLASRRIVLPDSDPDDSAGIETVEGLSRQKNQLLLPRLKLGSRSYPGSEAYLRALATTGLPCAVVSSSTNCLTVLTATGLEHFFSVRVDGITAHQEHLAGKPAPDTFLFAARHLDLDPTECVIYEDALAGVAAGRAGRFGQIIGVDRVGQAAALRAAGATTVVSDLAQLLTPQNAGPQARRVALPAQ